MPTTTPASHAVGTVFLLQQYVLRCEAELAAALEALRQAETNYVVMPPSGLTLARLVNCAGEVAATGAELGDARRALRTEVETRTAAVQS